MGKYDGMTEVEKAEAIKKARQVGMANARARREELRQERVDNPTPVKNATSTDAEFFRAICLNLMVNHQVRHVSQMAGVLTCAAEVLRVIKDAEKSI